MADISIRGLDDHLRDRLRVRAAQHGRSMEAEIREILAEAAPEPAPPEDWLSALIKAAQDVGGVELDIPPRTEMPRVIDFSEW